MLNDIDRDNKKEHMNYLKYRKLGKMLKKLYIPFHLNYPKCDKIGLLLKLCVSFYQKLPKCNKMRKIIKMSTCICPKCVKMRKIIKMFVG